MNKAPCFLYSFNKYLNDGYMTETMFSAIDRMPLFIECMI